MPNIEGTNGPDRFTPSGKDVFTMTGLLGDDHYLLRIIERTPGAAYMVYRHDVVTEGPDGGNDSVTLRANYTPTFTAYGDQYPYTKINADELANIEAISVIDNNRKVKWVITAGDNNNILRGPNGDDTLVGGGGDDVVYGNGGRDQARGGDGNDLVLGGGGNDTLFGDDGADQLAGGSGDDIMFGSNDGDRMHGGAGVDLASYVRAADGVQVSLSHGGSAGPGGSAGDSFASIENLDGSRKGDVLIGNGGANAIAGSAGNDVLGGGFGNDRLDGGLNVDRLDGGFGNDLLYVGWNQGADELIGGAGSDVFRFELAGAGSLRRLATIADFQEGETIALEVEGEHSVAAFVSQTGDDARVEFRNVFSLRGGGLFGDYRGFIVLQDTDIGTITRSDFSGRIVAIDYL